MTRGVVKYMADTPVSLRYAGVAELSAALRSRAVTPTELAEEAIRLLDGVGSRYNAVASLLPDRAQHEAIVAERMLASGNAGALCGIPYAVKDLFAARGGPTTWGSAAFANRYLGTDATVIRRLTAASSVLTAKLSMSEFAGGGRPAMPGASMHGQGRNPWDPRRYSGGSSSGSGIAVACGLVPFALGTETGGSILGPAAFAGVTGLRPTYGVVPSKGVMTLSWTLDKPGPLSRSADDCAAVMEVIAPRSATGKAFEEVVDDVLGSRRRIRVAFSEHELAEAAPNIRTALSAGIEAFRGIMPTFRNVELRRNPRFIEDLEEIVRIEGAYGLRAHLRDQEFQMTDARQRATLTSGLDAPAVNYLEAVRSTIPLARASFAQVFREADVILSASRPTIAPRLDEVRPPRDATKMSDLLRAAGNLAGLPGVSMPCGLSDEGLPVGLQLIGPRGSDRLLLGIAAAFQRTTSFHRNRPPS